MADGFCAALGKQSKRRHDYDDPALQESLSKHVITETTARPLQPLQEDPPATVDWARLRRARV